MLIVVLHWIACFWYYIINLNYDWIPPKDSADDTVIYTDSEWGSQYIEMFYYAILALVGNEMYPTNSLEIGVVSMVIIAGSIIIGTIVGEFSSILGEISKKANL